MPIETWAVEDEAKWRTRLYSDGIVCRATLSSDLPFDCRVSFLGRSLSPVCGARLFDSDENEWDVPPLENHYLFVPLEKSWTVLIPQGKTVSITHVDKLESPRPITHVDKQVAQQTGHANDGFSCFGVAPVWVEGWP